LEGDLAWSDLIIFSYSTVADEAWLQGKPAWQWLQVGFNGSALVEAVGSPQFGSVESLRRGLQDLVSNYRKYTPTTEMRALAARRLFAPADGMAAERIVGECEQLSTRSEAESHQP